MIVHVLTALSLCLKTSFVSSLDLAYRPTAKVILLRTDHETIPTASRNVGIQDAALINCTIKTHK